MKKINVVYILICCLIVSCGTTQTDTKQSEKLNQLFEEYKAFEYFSYPTFASYEGVHDYSDRLTDLSSSANAARNDSIKQFKKHLLEIDKHKLSEADQLNYDLFLYSLTESIEQDDLGIDNYLSFNQQNGFHIFFPQIIGYQPFESEKDVKNYISRLKQFKIESEHIIENLKEGKAKQIVLPCNVSEQVLAQLENFAKQAIEASPLFSVVAQHELSEAQAKEIKNAIEANVVVGYQNMYEFFKNQYHPNCRTEVGISNVKNGKAYYEFLTRKFTSSDLTPDAVFKVGNEEVDRIQNEIESLQQQLGFGNLTLNQFFEALRTDEQFYFSEKKDLMAGFAKILMKMDTKLPDLFGQLPKTPYELNEIEAYRAAAAPAAYYYSAPSDGSRPGYFYVNTYNLSARPKYTMTALALHEAVPGHHLQIAINKEMENVPWFRNQMGVTAFVEGWGLYAEYLGYETGMYEDDLQRLGALTFEMWRACRLVLDVGIHYKNWSKQKAVDFMKAHLPLSDLDINSEVDRYISWPGQALAYKMGELKIKELRQYAEKELGEKFDIKTFHDKVLENGSIPLSLLETNIHNWVKASN